jgi:hypothetical protein
MTGNFPLAQALREGKEILGLDIDGMPTHGGYGLDMIRHDQLALLLDLEQTAYFNIDLAAQLYWTGRKDHYVLGKDFGPMRPPYPIIWFEFDFPRKVLVEGRWVNWEERGENAPHMGIICLTQHQNTADYTIEEFTENVSGFAAKFPDYFVEGKDGICDQIASPEALRALAQRVREMRHEFLTVSVMGYMRSDATGLPIYMPYGKQIGLNTDGTFDGYCMDLVPKTKIPRPVLRAAKEMADMNPVWMALNLINCRNVTTKQSGSVLTRTTAQKRQGVPVKRFHTIVLPGMATRYVGARGRKQQAQDLAAHLVRGHFATYGPEAPLFGKHVGTFWVGWHVRGDKAHGEVIKDYELGPHFRSA